jgi:hypothetical protein
MYVLVWAIAAWVVIIVAGIRWTHRRPTEDRVSDRWLDEHHGGRF